VYPAELQLAVADLKSRAKPSSYPNGELSWICTAPSEQSEQFAAAVVALPEASHEKNSSSQYRPDDL
jgi:hypothetical protein